MDMEAVEIIQIRSSHQPFRLLIATVCDLCKQSTGGRPFDTDTALILTRWDDSPVVNLSPSSLGAAEHLWPCANYCAKVNPDGGYNHSYVSHKAVGKKKTTFNFTALNSCHLCPDKPSNLRKGFSR